MLKRKRTFIAICLPDNIKEQLSEFQRKWPELPCKWVKKENLHITLNFLGDLKQERIDKAFEVLQEISEKNNQFSILFNKICYGPDQKIPPRLVWAQGENTKEFLKLKQELDSLLAEKINFTIENRNFTPHITLARIKKWDWQKIDLEERPDVNLSISIQIQINSIEIMESRLKRTGAEYKILKSFKLKRGEV